MNYTEIKDKSVAELNTMLIEKKKLLFELKRKLKTMQLTNPNEIREVKKDIARVKTAITEVNKGA
ncbi:50S ribosomal protein L29 [Campylobacter ureolyticus]|uniref:50S ribosomal protein L29 n=1 Tax=Campylobacter ureolyticus TaxID=827 RepID=UPI00290B49F0|nr:50S ribosomal protein L29 [Campylobacter ureolyticus]MDU5325592.1 50S ribosomal protein L29 [Campylobacter ureolyticus]